MFVLGRDNLDNIILAQEVIHSMKNKSKSKKGSVAKAYDWLEWNFIENTLRKYKFLTEWIELIMQCVSTTSYRILYNGYQTSVVKPHNGVRQETRYHHNCISYVSMS